MIRRRPTTNDANSYKADDDKLGKQLLFTTSSQQHSTQTPKPMVSNLVVCIIVIVFVGAGVVQNRYQESHNDFHSGSGTDKTVAQSSQRRKTSFLQQSLLTPEEDERLQTDERGNRYHLVFSTDCSPYQHWQSFLVYYTALKVRQPGQVTRIASGCDPEQAKAMQRWFDQDVQFMSKRYHLQMTPHFSGVKNEAGETVADYKFFNKPFGFLYWLEHSPQLHYSASHSEFPKDFQNDIVILIDPDMGLLRPITADFSDERETVISPRRREHGVLATNVGPGHPFAQVYGFGTQWARLDLEKIAGAGSQARNISKEDGQLFYPVGPPYIGTISDMHRIALKWTAFVPRVYEQYPHLLAEMFAFCIAAADEELPFQLIDSLMISKTDASGEGWPLVDRIPPDEVCDFASDLDPSKYAVPSVVHLCQRYWLGKDWFFSKRKIPSDIYDCETPLFEEPPSDLGVLYDYKWAWNGRKQMVTPTEANREAFLLCFLFRLLNDAATFYKQNTCPPDSINLEKSRNLVAYLKAKSRHTETK
jgi:hypothetical protein